MIVSKQFVSIDAQTVFLSIKQWDCLIDKKLSVGCATLDKK